MCFDLINGSYEKIDLLPALVVASLYSLVCLCLPQGSQEEAQQANRVRVRLLVSCVGCVLRVSYLMDTSISAHLVVVLLTLGISSFASPFLRATKQ